MSENKQNPVTEYLEKATDEIIEIYEHIGIISQKVGVLGMAFTKLENLFAGSNETPAYFQQADDEIAEIYDLIGDLKRKLCSLTLIFARLEKEYVKVQNSNTTPDTNDEVAKCQLCGKDFKMKDLWWTSDNYLLCWNCYENNVTPCSKCGGDYVHRHFCDEL